MTRCGKPAKVLKQIHDFACANLALTRLPMNTELMNPPTEARNLRKLDRGGNCGTTATNATVAVYHSHAEAEMAVKELQRAGFDMKKLSIIGRDYHTDEHVVGYYNAGDRMKYWGKNGAFWGGIWGMLFGSAFFVIPGVGPLLVAGPLVAWILGALEGVAVMGGLSVIGAGLFSLGIPKNSILQYETALKTGKFVLVAHGSTKEVAQARDIISQTPAEAFAQHHPVRHYGALVKCDCVS